jgi:lipoate-protein ligase A
LTLPTAEGNLALDESLLLEAEAGRGGEVLRLWEWAEPAVVLGSACKLAEDCDEAACLADGVPILRRSSGGGTVLLGQGCLCYSLVLRFDRDPLLTDVRRSYRVILAKVMESLGVPGAEQAGISDLAVAGHKFSGNAQQRKRNHLLHHGTLLYDFDLSVVGRYLREPPKQPEYRGNREHDSFLRNLERPREELTQALRRAWQADKPLERWPEREVVRLVEEKYSTPAWNRRR